MADADILLSKVGVRELGGGDTALYYDILCGGIVSIHRRHVSFQGLNFDSGFRVLFIILQKALCL